MHEVKLLKREELLQDKQREKRDPQTIFVCDWHPKLSSLPAILKQNYHIIENDPELSKIFPTKPIVAYKRPKSIRNHIMRSDIVKKEKQKHKITRCGKCKLCKTLSLSEKIVNTKAKISIPLQVQGGCRSKNLIYAAQCKKHQVTYVGHTGDHLNDRFSKHRYDTKKRPGNSELAEHFNKGHTEDDMEVFILQTGLPSEKQREFFEDRWICRLQTLNAINTDIHQFAKDMYSSFKGLSA